MWNQLLLAILAFASPIPTESFAELRTRYESELRAYNQDPAGKPHPVRAYWSRIEAFGDQGDPQAYMLLVDNLSKAFDDPAETRTKGTRVLDRLMQAKLDEETELGLLTKLNRQMDAIPGDVLFDICQVVYEKGNSVQTRTQALWMCAWIRSEKGTTTDPERRAEAVELMNQILMEHPDTPAGTRAATEVFKSVNQDFVDAQWAWVKAVGALQAAGKAPQDWPQMKLDDFRPLYVPLARAKLQPAMKWLKELYPAFERARRTGNTGPGLAGIVDAMEIVYPVKSLDMAKLRLSMLSLLYTQFASEEWVDTHLQHVAEMAGYYPFDELLALLGGLAEKSTNPEVRARALDMQADLLTTTSKVEDDRRAIVLYERVLREFPHTEVIATDLQGRLDRLKRVMPGTPAPDAVEHDEDGKDLNLAEFRGRVVMFEFHELKNDECLKGAPLRGALAKSMEGRPFTLACVRVGVAIPKRIEEYHAAYGVPFRSIVIDMPKHAILRQWMVRKFPATYVIDAEGILRGRDMSWDETVKLVEKLVAEAEKRPQK